MGSRSELKWAQSAQFQRVFKNNVKIFREALLAPNRFTFPHPRMKAVDGDVHFVVSEPKRLEPVETSALVGELQVAQESQVNVEPHQLVSET